MVNDIIDDAQVIFEQSVDGDNFAAGGESGLVILNSVSLAIERSVDGYSGLGNNEEVATSKGTKKASMDHESMLNKRSAEMLATLYNNNGDSEVSVIAGDVLDASAATFVWENLDLDLENDGDQMVSVSGKILGLDIEANPSEES